MTRILALIALILPSSAVAHMAASGWEYPMECCSGEDCAEVPVSAVRFDVRGGIAGYVFELGPAMHPMLHEARTFFVREEDAKPSPDGKPHACIGHMDENEPVQMICAYVVGGNV